MILFYLFISIIAGCTIIKSPLLGLFFYAILLYSSHLKGGSLLFKAVLTLTAAAAAFIYFNEDTVLDNHILTDVVIEDYKYYTDSLHYIVSKNGRTYELYDEQGSTRLDIGNTCRGSMQVTIPPEQRNFIKNDVSRSLKINELAGRIYLNDTAELECKAGNLTFSQKLSKIRYAYMSKVLNASVHDYKFDILTLSIGNKNYISPDFFDALQKLGIYHLYVISGTHVAFLSAVIFGVLKYLRLPLNMIKILIIISLIFFLFLNFFSPSVLRAVFMGVLLLVCSFFKKKPYLAIISLSALIQILINPYVIYHAGFQLSYVTTYFILLTRPLFMHYSSMIQLVLITVISELSTLVIVLIHFNEISISGLILNIIFVPVFSFIIFPSVIVFNLLIFLHFPPMIDELYHLLYSLMKSCIYFISDAFKHRIPVKNLSETATIILLFLTYRLAVNVLQFNAKKIMLCIMIFITVLAVNHQRFNTEFTLTMVDVGQGDAFVIQDHRNYKTVLIDTGGAYKHDDSTLNLSDKTLLPYLKEEGIDFIDLLIISHLDLDHSGEVINILQKKEVGNIIMNTKDVKFDEWVRQLSPRERSLIADTSRFSEFSVGDIHFENFLREGASTDSNEQSLVLKAHLNHFSILFTGDVGLQTEEELVSLYNLKSDILKVGHHGSDTSSGESFIDEVDPKISLISAGVNNRYGHPHDSVIKTLEPSRIISTNTGGMVEFKINHDTICIRAKFSEHGEECLKKDIKKEPESRPE